MTFNKNMLPSRLELAKLVMSYFETKAEAKESKNNEDWADHYRIGRELREKARSIIYLEEE